MAVIGICRCLSALNLKDNNFVTTFETIFFFYLFIGQRVMICIQLFCDKTIFFFSILIGKKQ